MRTTFIFLFIIILSTGAISFEKSKVKINTKLQLKNLKNMQKKIII